MPLQWFSFNFDSMPARIKTKQNTKIETPLDGLNKKQINTIKKAFQLTEIELKFLLTLGKRYNTDRRDLLKTLLSN